VNETKNRGGRWLLSVLAVLALLGCLAPDRVSAQQRDPKRKVFAYGQTATAATALCTTASLTVSKETGAFRVTVALTGVNSVFNVQVINSAGDYTYTLALNAGTALTAGNLYTFTIGVDTNCTYNFTCTTTTTLAYFAVDESTGDGL
jgi:hypothetical protein